MRRLERNFKDDIVIDMQKKYPGLCDPHNLEAFKRKWIYMFEYAEAGYARAYTSLNCWTFTRPVSTHSRNQDACGTKLSDTDCRNLGPPETGVVVVRDITRVTRTGGPRRLFAADCAMRMRRASEVHSLSCRQTDRKV